MGGGKRTGEFIISFDFEIGWGSIENGLWYEYEKNGVYRELRDTLKERAAKAQSSI